jgi:hypothetical protein
MAQLPAVSGVTARYIGNAGGTTNWYYWIQAIYPDGYAQLSAPASTTAKAQASLSQYGFVNVQWNPAPGAIAYKIYRNTTGTTPTTGSILVFLASSETGLKDDGSLTIMTDTVRYDGLYVAQAYYNVPTDGGTTGNSYTPAISDTIPANAILLGGQLNSTTAFVGSGASVAVGTSAGSSTTSIRAATAITSFTADALVNTTVTFAAAVKMSAAGQINVTISGATVTAGVLEIFVLYVLPTNP